MSAATDRELLELAAKAAGYAAFNDITGNTTGLLVGQADGRMVPWNPLADDGDALRLAAQLHINIMFNGGFHHVGTDRWVSDICRSGGMSEIRWGIVHAAAEIGKAMP